MTLYIPYWDNYEPQKDYETMLKEGYHIAVIESSDIRKLKHSYLYKGKCYTDLAFITKEACIRWINNYYTDYSKVWEN